MKPTGWLIIFSFAALVLSFLVWLRLEFPGDPVEQERLPAPDFYLRNQWAPYIESFKKHLNGVSDFSAVLQKMETMGTGTWSVDLNHGLTFVCPYLDEFENLKTVILIETGERGTASRESVNFFGSRATIMEDVTYSLFTLRYLPAYTLIDSGEFEELIGQGYNFETVVRVEEISPGRFLEDVMGGKGPVVVSDSGKGLTDDLVLVLEHYNLRPVEPRYFLKR